MQYIKTITTTGYCNKTPCTYKSLLMQLIRITNTNRTTL